MRDQAQMLIRHEAMHMKLHDRLNDRLRAQGLPIDELEAVVRDVPAIEVWDPMQVLPQGQLRHADLSTTARVLGQSERFERVSEALLVVDRHVVGPSDRNHLAEHHATLIA